MIKIYRDFILQDIFNRYTTFRWKRKYNGLTEMEIYAPFEPKLYQLLQLNTVLYHETVKEACFIKNINIYDDWKGHTQIHIKGIGVESLLNQRVATVTASGTVNSLINNLLVNNFTANAGADRYIPEFLIGNLAVKNQGWQNIDYQNKTGCLNIIEKLLESSNIGFRVTMDFPRKKYIFDLYEGESKDYVVYSRGFNNIVSQDIYFLGHDYKNVVYVGDNAVGTATGLNRYESAIMAVAEENYLVTGGRFLEEHNFKQTIDFQIDNQSPQFVYLVDWNLGDVITFRDEVLDLTIKKNVIEIIEFEEAGNKKIDVTLGEYL